MAVVASKAQGCTWVGVKAWCWQTIHRYMKRWTSGHGGGVTQIAGVGCPDGCLGVGVVAGKARACRQAGWLAKVLAANVQAKV